MRSFILFVFVLTFTFSLKSQINLSQGLMAYYPFSGDVKDHSGNNNHGTISGNPVLVNDKDGNSNSAYKFNGNGDHIWVKDHPTLRPDTAMTIAAWVYCEDFTSWNIVVCKRAVHNGSPWNSYILYASGTAGTPQNWGFGIASSQTNTHFAIDNATAQTGKWIHLVGIYEKSPSATTTGDNNTQVQQNVRVYVDCEMVAQEQASGSIYYTDSSLRIAMAIPGPSKQYFKGNLDEIRIYNRALNELEINALCKQQFTQSLEETTSDELDVKVYPNPASSAFFVQCENIENITFSAYDFTGKQIFYNERIENDIINVEALSNGVYYFQFYNSKDKSYTTKKIIINN